MPFSDKNREMEVINHWKNNIKNNTLHEEIDKICEDLIKIVKKSYVLKKNNLDIPWKKIGIIGLGIIGGSIVKALKALNYSGDIVTLKRHSKNNKEALKNSYISKEYESIEELAQNTDLIIIASPIDDITNIAMQISTTTINNSNLTVMDVASVKAGISKTFEKLTTKNIEFIATHPMAGSDKSGFNHAKSLLFVNNPWVICPHSKNNMKKIDQIVNFISQLGAIPNRLKGDLHDKYIASSSHLVRLISIFMFAYIHDTKPEALNISGTGFKKMTALTSSNSLMNMQIYNNNCDSIKKEINEFVQYISNIDLNKKNSFNFFEGYRKKRAVIKI
jgi:prephenate dehydrogenase